MSRVGGTSSPPTPPLKWIWKHRHHQNIAICKQIACFEMSVRPFGPFSFGKGPSGRRSLPYGRLRLLFFIVTRRPVQSIALRALNNRSLRRLRRLRLLLFFARRAIFLSRTSRCTLSSFWDQNELSVPRRSGVHDGRAHKERFSKKNKGRRGGFAGDLDTHFLTGKWLINTGIGALRKRPLCPFLMKISSYFTNFQKWKLGWFCHEIGRRAAEGL